VQPPTLTFVSVLLTFVPDGGFQMHVVGTTDLDILLHRPWHSSLFCWHSSPTEVSKCI